MAWNQLAALDRLQSGHDFKEIISCLSLSLPFILLFMLYHTDRRVFKSLISEEVRASWTLLDRHHQDVLLCLIALVIPMALSINSLRSWAGVSVTLANAFSGQKSQKYNSMGYPCSKCIGFVHETYY